MGKHFFGALEALLSHAEPRAIRQPRAAAPSPLPPEEPEDLAEKRRKWFAKLAEDRLMPMLREVADKAKKHNMKAACELHETDGRLTAELIMTRGQLPRGARPPRLSIYANEGRPPVMVEFTGTFPHLGATGGFGAEIEYDPVYPDQIEEKVLDFIELVVSGGEPPANFPR